jgi:hypothetical protein
VKPEYWPRQASAEDAVALLQREGVWHIGGCDGCLCTSLSIMNFEIDIGCRKSDASKDGETVVTVSCSSLGVETSDLNLVAEEVKRQVLDAEPQADVAILFREQK